jgi:membrane peptidoglycan carboxypeptidase
MPQTGYCLRAAFEPIFRLEAQNAATMAGAHRDTGQALGMLLFLAAWKLPDPEGLLARPGPRSSGIYDRTGAHLLYEISAGEKTLLRKLRELLLSLAFEKRFSKDQILEMYLNEIPYGSTIYGVGAAAESYHRKPASELTLAEAAKAQATPLQAPVVPIQAPHFVMLVKEQLEARYGRRLLEEGGFRVITTLDYGKQQAAEQAVREGFERWGGRLGFSNAALVAVQPGSGQVLAMVGSRDYFDPRIAGMVNVAVSPRQPGSSIKPIIYTEAFELGYTPSTILWDVRTTFGEGEEEYIPEDYDHEERGPMSMRQALQGSINIPAVKTLYLVGVSRALAFARSLGYDSFGDPSRLGLSFALGAGEVSLLEHVNAYATLAAEGSYHASVTMLRVEDAQGVVLEQWRPSPTRQAVTANAARMITDVLADNEARTPFYGSHSLLQLGSRPDPAVSRLLPPAGICSSTQHDS